MIGALAGAEIKAEIEAATNARVWGDLRSDHLSDVDGSNSTYIRLLNHNAYMIISALTHPLKAAPVLV